MRHESYVFLDVTWFATIIKPLLSHKGIERYDGSVFLGETRDPRITLVEESHILSWRRLQNHGILEPELARVMWPSLSDYVLPTLVSVGLAFPLENDPAQGLVVLLRLGTHCPSSVTEELEMFGPANKADICARWRVFLGVPPGAVEKVLTQCGSIGVAQTFWRFGVWVQGRLRGKDPGRFAFLVQYFPETHELEMKVYGDVGTSAPWAALAYGLSATLTMALEYPGLRRRAHVTCPQHGEDMPINNKVRECPRAFYSAEYFTFVVRTV